MYLHVLFLQTGKRLIFDISAATVTEVLVCTTITFTKAREVYNESLNGRGKLRGRPLPAGAEFDILTHGR